MELLHHQLYKVLLQLQLQPQVIRDIFFSHIKLIGGQLVRVLINGSPIASHTARRYPTDDPGDAGRFADRPEGIAHDRWDVLIRTAASDTLVECGSVRERVSQELARSVFDAVEADMEDRDLRAAAADRTPTATTTPVR